MSNSNLASLPPSMLHKILPKVVTNHLRDFGSAKVALPAFNQIGIKEYLYKSIDEVNAVRTYMLKCYRAGNPQAICLRGMYEFFVLHLLDQGREKTRLAGERGFMLAKYVDDMLNLAFSVDERGLVHNFPTFTHEIADQMDHMIATKVSSGHWGYEKLQIFMSLLEKIDPIINYNFWCSEMIQPVFVVSLDGSRTR
ncbi:unnamed protein product [Eruca vesicaria subsp. sativa]|uniref:At2g35280-like TPR domain-containing protein n=1 Tax=Eruca vesicaria subsp. sativa TaxID=29727 RepID=A0ABC8M7P8_ERUVS|nr:unnamed protein product [Eruca vesicaria subsp. sativa]